MATFEKDGKIILEDLLAIYNMAEIEMLEKVAKRVSKGITKEGWNEQYLSEVQGLKQELNNILGKVNKDGINIIAGEMAKAYKGDDKNMTLDDVLKSIDIPMNLKQLLNATHNVIQNASFQILRNADDAYTKVMANASTALLSGQDTRIGVTQRMLNEYAAKGITTFADKAGRNWNLASYSEMCARTVSAHAALEGHIERMNDLGEDLMKVSTIGTTCPICSKWQGVVISISGKTKGYHTLDDAKGDGLFHPNCGHTLLLYSEELDGPGKKELNKVEPDDKSQERYNLTQKQRANERSIRYWKSRSALAITPEEKAYADSKVKQWQYKNLIHCEKNDLRRMYVREGNPKGYANGKIGAISGTFKEMEDAYKDIIGTDAKETFQHFKINLGLTGSGATNMYTKWLKSEIKSLDEYDTDMVSLKDKDNKKVTLTSIYQKYIGDTPAQDYASITEFEKGTKEYKTGYAKWLKEQANEIGKTYKVKPEYKEVKMYVTMDDLKLSATELYKKYYGKKPTDVFKEEKGYMEKSEYSKWLTHEKNKLITEGVTHKVKYENANLSKTTQVINDAKAIIEDAKDAVTPKVTPKAAPKIIIPTPQKKEPEPPLDDEAKIKELSKKLTTKEKLEISDKLDLYDTTKKKLQMGIYSASQEVKSTYEDYIEAKNDGVDYVTVYAYEKWKHAKKLDLEINMEKANKTILAVDSWGPKFDKAMNDLQTALANPHLNDDAKKHVEDKYKIWKDLKYSMYKQDLLDELNIGDITDEMVKETVIIPKEDLSAKLNHMASHKLESDINNKLNKEVYKVMNYDTDYNLLDKAINESADKMFMGMYNKSKGTVVPDATLVAEHAKLGALKEKSKIANNKMITDVASLKSYAGTFDSAIDKLNKEIGTIKNPILVEHKKELLAIWEKAKANHVDDEHMQKVVKAMSSAEANKIVDLTVDDKLMLIEKLGNNHTYDASNELDNEFMHLAHKFEPQITLGSAKNKTHFDTASYSKSERDEVIKQMKPLQGVHDYTSGSMPFNLCFKNNPSADYYFEHRSRYTREQARTIATEKIDKVFEANEGFKDFKVLRHGNSSNEALYSLLGGDFDDCTEEKFNNRLIELNKGNGNEVFVERGYFSTSPHMDKGFTSKNIEVRILAHPGVKGVYVEPMSYYKGCNEDEIILPRNQKFKFVKAYSRYGEGFDTDEFKEQTAKLKGSRGGQYLIFLEALP